MICVGAPVHARGWILQQWFDALAAQTYPATDIDVVLNYGHSEDDTLNIITAEMGRGRFHDVKIILDGEQDHQEHRAWNEERYATMARLRNALLHRVRAEKPDYYLSCDTDMLLPPEAIETLLAELQAGEYGAVGPLTHMTPTGICPNAFDLTGNRWQMSGGQQERVFAVFGVVLMGPTAYAQDYGVHRQGEDVYWATQCWQALVPMAIVPKVKVKHVMNPAMLDPVDPRIGF